MRKVFKVNQRIKRGLVRGTVLEILKAQGLTQYIVKLDNGAKVLGTRHQFEPVRRAQR